MKSINLWISCAIIILFQTVQSYANGYLMVSPGAASTSVFTKNDHTFGTFTPASTYFRVTLMGLAARSAAVDADPSSPFASRCTEFGAVNCVSAIRVGFLQAGVTFTRSMCASGGAIAAAAGLATAKRNGTSDTLIVEVMSEPSMEEMLVALNVLRNANVTVIIGCTYEQTANRLIAGLI